MTILTKIEVNRSKYINTIKFLKTSFNVIKVMLTILGLFCKIKYLDVITSVRYQVSFYLLFKTQIRTKGGTLVRSFIVSYYLCLYGMVQSYCSKSIIYYQNIINSILQLWSKKELKNCAHVSAHKHKYILSIDTTYLTINYQKVGL